MADKEEIDPNSLPAILRDFLSDVYSCGFPPSMDSKVALETKEALNEVLLRNIKFLNDIEAQVEGGVSPQAAAERVSEESLPPQRMKSDKELPPSSSRNRARRTHDQPGNGTDQPPSSASKQRWSAGAQESSAPPSEKGVAGMTSASMYNQPRRRSMSNRSRSGYNPLTGQPNGQPPQEKTQHPIARRQQIGSGNIIAPDPMPAQEQGRRPQRRPRVGQSRRTITGKATNQNLEEYMKDADAMAAQNSSLYQLQRQRNQKSNIFFT